MKKYYKHSLTAFVIGMILGIAVSFVSITVAWIVIGVSILNQPLVRKGFLLMIMLSKRNQESRACQMLDISNKEVYSY